MQIVIRGIGTRRVDIPNLDMQTAQNWVMEII